MAKSISQFSIFKLTGGNLPTNPKLIATYIGRKWSN